MEGRGEGMKGRWEEGGVYRGRWGRGRWKKGV